MSAAGSTAPSSSAAVSSAGGSTGQQQQQQQLYVDLFRFYDTDSSGSIDAHKLKVPACMRMRMHSRACTKTTQ